MVNGGTGVSGRRTGLVVRSLKFPAHSWLLQGWRESGFWQLHLQVRVLGWLLIEHAAPLGLLMWALPLLLLGLAALTEVVGHAHTLPASVAEVALGLETSI